MVADDASFDGPERIARSTVAELPREGVFAIVGESFADDVDIGVSPPRLPTVHEPCESDSRRMQVTADGRRSVIARPRRRPGWDR